MSVGTPTSVEWVNGPPGGDKPARDGSKNAALASITGAIGSVSGAIGAAVAAPLGGSAVALPPVDPFGGYGLYIGGAAALSLLYLATRR